MIQRCRNQSNDKWAGYGGRGIAVCERWKDYGNFYADMGDKPSELHSLDRIDNKLGYSPENCRWATRKEQQNNRRVNRMATVGGETLTAAQWDERMGFREGTVATRIANGWLEDQAVLTPVAFGNRGKDRVSYGE